VASIANTTADVIVVSAHSNYAGTRDARLLVAEVPYVVALGNVE
jgi:hypothetical protein